MNTVRTYLPSTGPHPVIETNRYIPLGAMFKPAVTDPEEIKAILQKTLTAKAEGNTGTATSSAAASKKEEEEESSKDDKAK